MLLKKRDNLQTCLRERPFLYQLIVDYISTRLLKTRKGKSGVQSLQMVFSHSFKSIIQRDFRKTYLNLVEDLAI